MKLSDKQIIFSLNVADLIIYANSLGIGTTFGEAYRTKSQQKLYYYGYILKLKNNVLKLIKSSKKSKTLNSYHLKRLAIDLNFFIDGDLINKDKIKVLGEYWKNLHSKNVWGGDWGWDSGHFEMRT